VALSRISKIIIYSGHFRFQVLWKKSSTSLITI